MASTKDLVKVDDYCSKFNLSTLHPLVSVHDLSEGTIDRREHVDAVRYHFYGIFLKQGEGCILRYGRQNYDYQDGTLVFLAPGQVVHVGHIDANFKPSGHALLFHPDLLHGTHLAKAISDYSFFSYLSHEALHISKKERQLVLDLFDTIRTELSQGIDKHSKEVVVATIELFLKYCMRFYNRQFITREKENLGVIQRFEISLNSYIQSGKARELGTPSVSYFAEEENLSSNYFGDLVKKETGNSAQEYIQAKLIDIAKERVFDPAKSISEIAYELGFKYPQHFSRLFKQKVGYSPNEFRSLN
ncbi:AraC family transcriptional regulator [Flavobacteriaceae bacterium TP-CH-4]|uniref:AraC family transcriptional regulator n=1 Tax=Pelagihabitans pacificus TaxID=2696054 RepID=A0A967APZ0_9FLAO|nr:AraC family transcriptional regulator [Pelagihabitans pacificus]NHF58199.1 AraC family transcriptional regulator [Pelagihabitans pacificus]